MGRALMLSMYDAEKPVPLNGTVTAILWRNPEVSVFVDVKVSRR